MLIKSHDISVQMQAACDRWSKLPDDASPSAQLLSIDWAGRCIAGDETCKGQLLAPNSKAF